MRIVVRGLGVRIARTLQRIARALGHEADLTLPRPEGFGAMRAPLAGVRHKGYPVEGLALGERVRLRREPTNRHDKSAIVVETLDRHELGYVPRNIADRLAPYMDGGRNPLQAMVTELSCDVSGAVVGLAVGFYVSAGLLSQMGRRKCEYHCDVDGENVCLHLDCDQAVLSRVIAALTEAGVEWVGAGDGYRLASNGRQYRWYVRFKDGISRATVERALRETIGESPADLAGIIGLYEVEVSNLETEIASLKAQNEYLSGRNLELELGPKPPSRPREDIPAGEIGLLLQILLPEVRLLRDSLVVIQELPSYEPVLRLLQTASTGSKEVKAKKVQAAPEWWEAHFNTGQKDDGRLYFKRHEGALMMLISLKNQQALDIQYLRKR